MKQHRLDFERSAPMATVVPWGPRRHRRSTAGDRRLGGAVDAESWFQLGCELEAAASGDALNAYRSALELDAGHADAWLNLGRLLHEGGDLAAAERCYRRALEARPGDSTAAFNLGVALQDRGRRRPAIAAYLRAIDLDPDAADAHFNAALLYVELGERAAAVRHLKRYKALTRGAGLATV